MNIFNKLQRHLYLIWFVVIITSSTHQIYKSCNIHVYVSPFEASCSQSTLFVKALFARVIWKWLGPQPFGPVFTKLLRKILKLRGNFKVKFLIHFQLYLNETLHTCENLSFTGVQSFIEIWLKRNDQSTLKNSPLLLRFSLVA
jgi:hypothetical protein